MDLRRRAPFKPTEETSEDVIILDDIEQEELLQNLRKENAKSNKQSILMMKIVVLLSVILHLIYFINPANDPLLILLPRTNSDETIPLPRPFTLVSLVLHANLLLLLDSTSVRDILSQLGIGLDDNTDLGSYTLSPTLAYTLAFVAPTVCIFLRYPWLTVAWWSITPVVIYTVQLVLDATANGNEHIRSLEAMMYSAPSA